MSTREDIVKKKLALMDSARVEKDPKKKKDQTKRMLKMKVPESHGEKSRARDSKIREANKGKPPDLIAEAREEGAMKVRGSIKPRKEIVLDSLKSTLQGINSRLDKADSSIKRNKMLKESAKISQDIDSKIRSK